jgi:alpha-tubulin suppressor-like RCC1 family protein
MYVWGEGALEGIVDDDLIGAAVEPTKLLDGVVAVDEQQLFLKEDGTLWGWDWNVSCIKGYTSMDYDEEYAYPLLNHVVCMDAGGAYTGNKFGAAIKDDGTLWVWGSNSAGQIGLSDSYITYSPTKVMKDVIEVSCGNSYIMVLKSDGTVWASGSNENNKLGVDTDLNKVSEFTFVMDGVAHICAGFNTSYVIKKDGTLWGWGENKTGILGQGDTTDRSEPVKIMESVAAVATNQKATYFIRTDGTLYEMGYGYWESGMSRTPTQISEDAAFSGLTLTGSALMLVTQEGVLWYKQNDNLEQYELNILG